MRGFWPWLIALGLFATPRSLPSQTITTVDESGRKITRRCQPAVSKKDLPPLGAILDTAVALPALSSLPRDQRAPWTLSLIVARDGSQPTVRWVDSTGPDAAVAIVTAAILPQQRRAPWAVRLRIELQDKVTLVVQPGLYCPPIPRPTDFTGSVTRTVQIQPGDRLPTTARPQRIVVEVEVHETGTAGEVRLIEGGGIHELDAELIQSLKQRRYFPALLEGVAVFGIYRSR